MVPKTLTGKVDLLSFRPTPEELERAREMLASSDVKVKASKVRAMLQSAKGNHGDTANRILASRGDERLDYLARYIAFQDKKKKSKHSISLSNVEERGAHTDVVPMCEFQLRKEFGDGKTDAWLKSGALPYSRDRIKGSIEPECQEYQVPISWTRNSSKNVDAQTLEAEGDAAEDKINFQSLRDSPSGSSTDAVPLKVENPSPEDEAEHKRKQNTEKTAAFISSAPTTLKRLVDRAVDLRLLESKAGASEFTMAKGEKAVCVRKKTAKLVTMMEQLVTKQTFCNEAFIGPVWRSMNRRHQIFWSGATSWVVEHPRRGLEMFEVCVLVK